MAKRFRRARKIRHHKRRFHKKRNVNSKIYNYTRYVQGATDFNSMTSIVNQTTSSSGDTYFCYVFRLLDLPSITEFTNLYDQYKINRITMKFIHQQNMASVGAAAATTPLMYSFYDPNDSVAPTSVNACLEYQNVKITPFYRSLTTSFVPKVSSALYSGAFTSYGVAKSWIDVGSTGVDHYGLKVCLPACSGTNVAGWRILTKYHMSFKNVR